MLKYRLEHSGLFQASLFFPSHNNFLQLIMRIRLYLAKGRGTYPFLILGSRLSQGLNSC